jgi:hypothetical protein
VKLPLVRPVAHVLDATVYVPLRVVEVASVLVPVI